MFKDFGKPSNNKYAQYALRPKGKRKPVKRTSKFLSVSSKQALTRFVDKYMEDEILNINIGTQSHYPDECFKKLCNSGLCGLQWEMIKLCRTSLCPKQSPPSCLRIRTKRLWCLQMIMIMGPTNCAKKCLFKTLQTMFKDFDKPSNNKYV